MQPLRQSVLLIATALTLVALASCGKSEDSNVTVSFDQSALAEAAQSALVAAIRPTDTDIEVIFVSDFQSLDAIQMSSELANDASTRIVLLAFQENLVGQSPVITTAPSADLVSVTAVTILSTNLVGGTRFQALDSSSADHDLIREFANRIYVTETSLEITPTPTVTPTITPTPTPTPTPIPNRTEIIIDDNDIDSIETQGNWSKSTYFAGGYPDDASGYHYTDDLGPTTWFQWNAGRLDGDFEIFVWFQANDGRPTQVPYAVYENGGVVRGMTVNQQLNGSRWVSLGTFTFTNGLVSIRVSASSASSADGTCADAVRLVGVEPDPDDPPDIDNPG